MFNRSRRTLRDPMGFSSSRPQGTWSTVKGAGGTGYEPAGPAPKFRRGRAGVPNPDDDRGAYIYDLQKRLRTSIEELLDTEAAIFEKLEWHRSKFGASASADTDGWIQLKQHDPSATMLFTKRENSRQRCDALGAAILVEIQMLKYFGP
jgi:hypothetical protein